MTEQEKKINALMEKLGIKDDYILASRLGCTPQTLRNYRNGSQPSKMMEVIMELTEENYDLTHEVKS